jgi:hypothetical protein
MGLVCDAGARSCFFCKRFRFGAIETGCGSRALSFYGALGLFDDIIVRLPATGCITRRKDRIGAIDNFTMTQRVWSISMQEKSRQASVCRCSISYDLVSTNVTRVVTKLVISRVFKFDSFWCFPTQQQVSSLGLSYFHLPNTEILHLLDGPWLDCLIIVMGLICN